MSDTIRYLHWTSQTHHNLWSDMSDLDRWCPTLVGRFWKMILFRWLQMTLILVDHETGCVVNLISLALHAYEEHPNWRLCTSYASIWSQSGLGLRIWLKVRLCNPELDLIPTLACTPPLLSNTLLMPHMSYMIHSLISRERKKKGMHKDWDVCLVVATWRKRQSNAIYNQWGGICHE
jgi:hypothetical protein